MTHSRYHVVRSYWCHTGALSAPYVLDRRDRTLLPYRGNADSRQEHESPAAKRASELALERFRRRLLSERTPAQSSRLAARLSDRSADLWGVCAMFDKYDLMTNWLLDGGAVSGAATISLNNNYVAGTSGNAFAARYLAALGGKTLSSLYFFISSYTGTAGSVTDIDVEVRPESSTGSSSPDTSTLTDSATVNPASATGWVKATGLTATLTSLARYFFIVGDANGSGTNFAVCQARVSQPTGLSQQVGRFLTVDTANGWLTPNARTITYANIVVGFNDGTAFGYPLTIGTVPSSTTHQRGLYIDSTAFPQNVPIFGMMWAATALTPISGMNIFSGSTAPNGTPFNSSTDTLYNNVGQKFGCLTAGGTPVTLSKGTAYRIVCTYASATTAGPQRSDIGTGADATLRAAMPGDGLLYWTEDDGASSWANDLNTSLPTTGLLLDGWAAASGGGSVLPRIIHQPGWAYYEG